jgi:uncharacterized damage-inducible protein DinB
MWPLRRKNVVELDLSPEPAIGPWLWALQDSRQRTLEELEQVAPAMVDWLPPDNQSSIGTVLYHLTDIEADWLYVEVLEQSLPPAVAAFFPYLTRDAQGQLTQIQGFSLEQHLERLATVRGWLLDVFQQMDLADFRRVRTLPHYDVTPEWVLHHLMQHEAEHRSQIGALRDRAARHLAQKDLP